MSAAPGRLITLEGGEGAGKSTQARLLCEALERRGCDVVMTREPGGTASAEAIRALLVEGDADRWRPLTEVLLHYAARNEHLHELLLPAMKRGAWIVSDRFADSTLAYQGYGLGVPRETIEAISRVVLGDFRPELTLVLDLPVEVGLRRAAGRRGNEARYESMPVPLHERLRSGFLEIAAADPARCTVIDAAGDPEAVHRRLWQAVANRFALRN